MAIFDPDEDALREVIRYEMTNVKGPLEFRIDHLVEALLGHFSLTRGKPKLKKVRKKTQKKVKP